LTFNKPALGATRLLTNCGAAVEVPATAEDRLMMSPLLLRAGIVACFWLAAGSAEAQVKLDTSYGISVARIPIGSDTASAQFSDKDYSITMTGRASGLLRVLASGEGTLTTVGIVKDGRPTPTRYVSSTTADDDKLDVTMTFEDGNVKDLQVSEPPVVPDRVPLTEAHRKGVTDPLTAMFIPGIEVGDNLSKAECQRTLPIFDGRRRYDLQLAFKRTEKVKADKGYAGPAVVCSVLLKPIAGHRTSSSLIKFVDGREIEMAFAPIAGTRVLAPFRISVFHTLGNLVIQANRFEIAAARPSTAQSTGKSE